MGQAQQGSEKVVRLEETRRAAERAYPHCLESERAVLGAVILGDGVVPALLGVLRSEDFYREQHQIIFEAVAAVQERHGAPDLMLLHDHLRQSGHLKKVGGLEYLSKLAHVVPVAANLWAHVRKVREAARRRTLLQAAERLVSQAFDGSDQDEAVGRFLATVSELDSRDRSADYDDYEVDGAALMERHFASEVGTDSPPVTTGYQDLDKQMGAWRPGDFVVIGAHEKTGKSFFALNLARNAAEAGRGVAFLGLEMLRQDNFARILSLESGVPHDQIRGRDVSRDKISDLVDAANRLAGLRLRVYDNRFTLDSIVATAYELKTSGKLDLLIVDHLGLIECAGQTDAERISKSCMRLRQLANQLGIVVVALAQFKVDSRRKLEDRPNRSWLMGGSAVKTLPSHIILLHRPDPNVSRCEVILDAMRHGKTGMVPLAFLGEVARFENWSNR